MSLHRRAAKRDGTEKAIVATLRAHGCIVWEVSGAGIPDLIVLRKGKKWLADTKSKTGKATPAQEKKWEEAATKANVSVFILRTPEDATKMLNNALEPWEPETCQAEEHRNRRCKCYPANATAPRKGDAAKVIVSPILPRAGYIPPRSTPVGRRWQKGCGNHGWDTTDERTWRCSDCAMPPDIEFVDAANEAEVFAPSESEEPRCTDGPS